MSSRFFRGDDDESTDEETSESSEEMDSDNDSGMGESDDDDDDDEGTSRKNRFLFDSDSDDDDVKRVIKSGKSKRFNAMVETSKKLRNHMKINDWISLQADFENLNKQLEKHMKTDIVATKKPVVPSIYIGSLVLVDDFLNKTLENSAKKLSKQNTKALNTMKQKVRKNNKIYEKQMQKFRDEGKSLDDEDILAFEDEEVRPVAGTTASKIPVSSRTADDEEDEGDFGDEAPAEGDTKKKLTPEEMSEDQLDERLREILSNRGRKGTNKLAQIDLIESLVVGAKSPVQRVNIYIALIAAQFDVTTPSQLFMPSNIWRSAVSNVREIIKIARESHPAIEFSDGAEVEVLFVEKKMEPMKFGLEDSDEDEEVANGEAEETVKPQEAPLSEKSESEKKTVRGDIATLVERLDDELYKAWQNTDAYGQEYVDLLKNERPCLVLMADAQDYYENVLEDHHRAARIAARHILHIYYKSDSLNAQIEKLYAAKGGKVEFPPQSLAELAALVYRYGEERAKSQTMLCHIYNHALGNRFFEARDMLLLSHLQDAVTMLDVPLQVLFNRTMAQIGLCAFRLGMPFEAHSALQELCTPSHSGSGGGAIRLRELLAQGMIQVRGFDKTIEQERAEKKRQVPYHMHLPLDLIDTAHLVSAMLLELPNMALARLRGDTGMKRRVISKTFQYYLRTSVKQAFSGPAENTRDHVMSAARSLMSSDWKKCYDIVASIRAWQSLDDDVAEATLLKVRELIKVEGLRTFVLTYSSYYNSLGTQRLSEMFELNPSKVHSVISKMIINEELKASWDQPTGCVMIRRTEPSRLQSLALQMAQKSQASIEHNEKLVDARTGGLGGRDDREDGREWKGGGGRGRGGYGGGRGGRGGYNRDRYQGGRDRDRDRIQYNRP